MYKVVRTVRPSSLLNQQKILSKGSGMNPFTPTARLFVPTPHTPATHSREPKQLLL